MDALDADGLWANRRLDRGTGGNLLLFGTALGDGSYPSFWGLTEGGEALWLVTDFFLGERTHEVVVDREP
jgi:hypothetical protein